MLCANLAKVASRIGFQAVTAGERCIASTVGLSQRVLFLSNGSIEAWYLAQDDLCRLCRVDVAQGDRIRNFRLCADCIAQSWSKSNCES